MTLEHDGSILKDPTKYRPLTPRQQRDLRAEWDQKGYSERKRGETDTEIAKKWQLMQACELIYRYRHGLLAP